jgi:ABC-type dipeptide/oligopeptide/nickel transport system ATPase component
MALANDPALLICDEPTTALDVTVQALVLDLIVRGVEARDAGMLFITHDLAVVASVCERVLVMYGGRVVEAGPVQRRLHPAAAPLHPRADRCIRPRPHPARRAALHDPGLGALGRALPARVRLPQPVHPCHGRV